MKMLHKSKAISIIVIIFMLINVIVPPTIVHADTTITVETSADNLTTNSLCSLREAINNANNDSGLYTDCEAGTGHDTIIFSSSLANGTIVLTSNLPALSDSDGLTITGLPYISGGDFGLSISGNNLYVIFSTSHPLTINDLIIKNGRGTFGGAIYINGGSLTVNNSNIKNNSSISESGGAIYSDGTLTINSSTIESNTAAKGGGAIYSQGTLTITNSSFINNTASWGGAINSENGTVNITTSVFSQNTGSAIYLANCDLEVSNSNFNSNSSLNASFGYGGAIRFTGTSLTISNSTFDGNTAVHGGGAVYENSTTANISTSSFLNSSVTSTSLEGNGGAIHSSSNSLTISGTTFNINNAIKSGGGLYKSTGTLNVSNSTFDNNTASNSSIAGGAIYLTSDTASIDNVIFQNNHAPYGFGGGVHLANGSLTITKSTFFNNNAQTYGGGFSSSGTSTTATIANSTFAQNSTTSQGGGIYIIEGIANLYNNTVSNNSSPNGGGLALGNIVNLNMYNTIIANSISTSDCYNSIIIGGVSGTNNLIETDGTGDQSCDLTNGVNGNIVGSDPILGVLTNNGGSTETMALLTGSPAINAGNNTTCSSTPVNNLDQRGLDRPQDTTCDIGAYEKMDASGFPTFVDVPTNAFGWAHIEAIYDFGITGGCTVTPLNYCPNNTVTRAQMAIFLLRGIHGSAYTPPAASGTLFTDVPISHPFAAWIEQLANEGITGGCGGGNYCPNGIVSRSQMAIFLLRAKYGSSYIPPAATGTMFADVPLGTFAPWIEQLANEGITGGCGGGNYCPNNNVTRAQMAIFIQRTFGLPLP